MRTLRLLGDQGGHRGDDCDRRGDDCDRRGDDCDRRGDDCDRGSLQGLLVVRDRFQTGPRLAVAVRARFLCLIEGCADFV